MSPKKLLNLIFATLMIYSASFIVEYYILSNKSINILNVRDYVIGTETHNLQIFKSILSNNLKLIAMLLLGSLVLGGTTLTNLILNGFSLGVIANQFGNGLVE